MGDLGLLEEREGGLFTLQETKVQNINKKIVLDLWGRRNFVFVHKPTAGGAGGILVAWNANGTEIIESKIREFSVSVLCKNKELDKVWAFIGVYGPYDQTSFGLLQEDSCKARWEWNVPWCVGGISMQSDTRWRGLVLAACPDI